MKIAVIVGVRPHFVKLSVLLPALLKRHTVVVINTAQHYDFHMAGQFFSELSLPLPDYSLGIGSGTHSEQTGLAMIGIERALIEAKVTGALVIGDANPSLAGALAAAKLGLPVYHVEAGVRNHEPEMAEEINRLCIDQVSSYLLCPTISCRDNLLHHLPWQALHFTGDLLLDKALSSMHETDKRIVLLEHHGVEAGNYLVATIHRTENTENKERLHSLVEALCRIDVRTIFPVHPRTMNALKKTGLLEGLIDSSHVVLTEPLSYLSMLTLLRHARVVITDSNGIQREAYFVRTPCIIARTGTEYLETVETGAAVLAGTDVHAIAQAVTSETTFREAKYELSLFGNGDAADKISSLLS